MNLKAQQVKQNIIVEHFTNTRCSICKNRNPGLFNTIKSEKGIIYMSVHPSAPYASCPLSKQNKVNNDDRTKYYGMYGSTPRIAINGNSISARTSFTSSTLLTPYLNLKTSFEIRYIQNIIEDSIKVSIVVKKVDTSTLTNASLYFGAVEDTVFVDGGNGEKEHYNVLRSSMTKNIILPTKIKDSIIVKSTMGLENFWDLKRFKSVSILHRVDNKMAIQSAIENLVQKNNTNTNVVKNNLNLYVYPNPAQDFIQIKTNKSNKLYYNLYFSFGIIVLKGSFTSELKLSTESLNNQFYFLRVFNTEFESNKMIVVKK